MASPILGEIEASVTNMVGVVDSAILLINSIAGRIQAAIAAALEAGATAEQLAGLTDEVVLLNTKAADLAAAVAANP